MARTIGVAAGDYVATGAVENGALVGPLRTFPEQPSHRDVFQGMPVEGICEQLRDQVRLAAAGREIAAVGLAFPGIIREGIVEDSPNLQQIKGWNLRAALSAALPEAKRVHVVNDAEAMAAGAAAGRGGTGSLTRLWFLGHGIGFGRYPRTEGVWEAGHSVVTLDPKERYCGCGGVGHLEGIMGHRAIRLRFLDLEPEEVFAKGAEGDDRCLAFVRLWHRALAAASATSVHLDGPGKFFLCGPNSRFADIDTLNLLLHDMVKMSPLQGSTFEVISASDDLAVIGAAITAERAE
jgi:predicted NBD/HSP70 family sugar kinase